MFKFETVQIWKPFKFENRSNLKSVQNIFKCENINKMFKFKNIQIWKPFIYENHSNLKRSNLKYVQNISNAKILKFEKCSDSKFVQIFRKFRFKFCSYSANINEIAEEKKGEKSYWAGLVPPAWGVLIINLMGRAHVRPGEVCGGSLPPPSSVNRSSRSNGPGEPNSKKLRPALLTS
jgi:hypothetical protein